MGLLDFLFGTATSSSSLSGARKARRDYDTMCEEDMDICEDMLAMRCNDPEADIEGHYGWEHKLSYDTDGYAEMEEEYRGDDGGSFFGSGFGSSDSGGSSDYGDCDSDW